MLYMAHWADIFLDCELSMPFKQQGYEVVYEGNGTVMMAPERAARWQQDRNGEEAV